MRLQGFVILLLCFCSVLYVVCNTFAMAQAGTMSIADIATGQIITVNGMRFAKTGVDPTLGSQFTAICESNACGSDPHCIACSTTHLNVCEKCAGNYAPIGGVCTACAAGTVSVGNTCVPGASTMQSWNGCAALATPAALGFTQGPVLIDERDGKSYEIRKFADGKCWMVDNLMYGGGTDGSSDYCSGHRFHRIANGASYTTATGFNGLNPPDGTRNILVGDCSDPRADGAAPCTAGSTTCGYYYNWAGAIQDVSGWRGNSFQPSQPTQGICPTGWHLPSGGTTGEYQTLHTVAGSSSTGFWQPGGSFKVVFSGFDFGNGSFYNGSRVLFWTSTQYNDMNANSAGANLDGGGGDGAAVKHYGLTVRCIKN